MMNSPRNCLLFAESCPTNHSAFALKPDLVVRQHAVLMKIISGFPLRESRPKNRIFLSFPGISAILAVSRFERLAVNVRACVLEGKHSE